MNMKRKKQNLPKTHHITIRLNESQFSRLVLHLKKHRKETRSDVIRESIHQYINNQYQDSTK